MKYFILILTLVGCLSDSQKINPSSLNNVLYDYELGLQKGLLKSKPILLWFTGKRCKANTESQKLIFDSSQIIGKLNEHFVTIILYVDDPTKFEKPELVIRNGEERKIKTLGNKWAHIEITKYQNNKQPFFTIIDGNETRLVDYDKMTITEEEIMKFLNEGISLHLNPKN